MSNAYITTFHWPLNYGAALQAYALSQAIQILGHKPEILDYRPFRLFFREAFSVLRSGEKRKMLAGFLEFQRKFLSLSTEVFWRRIPQSNTRWATEDIFICGSDQIWNAMITGGIDSTYMLAFAPPGARKFSYAASMGGVAFPQSDRRNIAQALEGFTSISAREPFTADQVRELTGRDVELVLDPVFLIDDYTAVTSERHVPVAPYAASFCIQDSLAYEHAVNTLKEDRGLPVFHLGPIKPQAVGNQLPALGPCEWLGVLKHAEYIITNSFHGLAFAIIFRRNFVCLGLTGNVASRNDRLSHLCRLLKLENHYWVEEEGKRPRTCKAEVDYREVDGALANERMNSLAYLKGSLQ